MFEDIKNNIKSRMESSIQSFKSDMQGIKLEEHLLICWTQSKSMPMVKK